MEDILPKPIVFALKKQKYQLVGAHSAVKKCRWLHKSLVEDKNCYNQDSMASHLIDVYR